MSGDLILDISEHLRQDPACLLLKSTKKDEHFDVCDEKGVVALRVKNDGDCALNAIIEGAKLRRITLVPEKKDFLTQRLSQNSEF